MDSVAEEEPEAPGSTRSTGQQEAGDEQQSAKAEASDVPLRDSPSSLSQSAERVETTLQGHEGQARLSCAVLRALSSSALAAICKLIKRSVVAEGEAVPVNECLTLLRSGVVTAARQDCAGSENSMRALTSCSCWVLQQDDYDYVCSKFPADEPSLAEVHLQATMLRRKNVYRELEVQELQIWLSKSPLFRGLSQDFTGSMCADLEDVYFAPGEQIVAMDRCRENPAMYIVVRGQVHVEDDTYALLRLVGAGETFGEAAAMNTATAAVWQARASPHGVIHLRRAPADVFVRLLGKHKDDAEMLGDSVRKLEQQRGEAARLRHAWISEHGVPAFAKTLLAGCPAAFMYAVAGQSIESNHDEDVVVVRAGSQTEYMHVVLQGGLDLLSLCNERVGHLSRGGAMGEVEVLGIFDQTMVTAKTTEPTRILSLSKDGLDYALSTPHGQCLRQGLSHLLDCRYWQVSAGMPLCGLRIGARLDDTSLRSVALQAERICLDPGVVWQPLPDSDPSGPRITVFVSGRVMLELAGSGREVMPLSAPVLVNEGMLAELGGQLHSMYGECDAYRMRVSDLLASAKSTSQPPDWFYQFRILEKETCERIRSRLSSARGLDDNKAVHPCDRCISEWSSRRRDSIRKAAKLRAAKANEVPIGKGSMPQLPLIPPSNFGTTSYRSWSKVPQPRPMYTSGRMRKQTFPKGLAAYPVLRLPSVASAPQLVAAVSKTKQRVHSEEDGLR